MHRKMKFYRTAIFCVSYNCSYESATLESAVFHGIFYNLYHGKKYRIKLQC